ncbi:MAG: MFS transporter [Prolixibacteraceae bacterium]|jgi:MFS family permease|nr:MFS transporter [Prolixibacteraceae bacterium]
MKNSKTLTTTYSWLVVAMLWVVALLNYLDRVMITTMRDPIVADFSLNDAQFGLLTSVFLWSYGLLSPFGGFLADKFSRKKMIIISIFVWSAVTLWTGFVSSFHEMLIARTCMGISEACYIPAGLALITEYHRDRTRSLATGLHMTGLYAGVFIAGLGGYIAELWGWRYGFQIFGVFGIFYSLFLLIFLKDKKKDKEEIGSNTPSKLSKNITISGSFNELFRVRSYNVLLIYFCIYGMVSWLVWGWFPTFLKDHFNLSLGQAGITATGFIQAGSFAGVVIGGILADRLASKSERGRLYVMIIGFILGAPFLFWMSSTQIFIISVLGMIFYGLARGFTDSNLMPVLCQVVDSRYIATGYGFLNFFNYIASGGMVLVGGALRDSKIDLSVTFQIAAIMIFLATLLLLTVKPRKVS